MSRRAVCRHASVCLLASFVAAQANAANYARSYLVNGVLLPTTSSQATDYAIDLDGDNHPDNNLGQILAALTGQGIDFAGLMDSAVSSGSIVHIVHLQTTDPLLANDPAAQVTWCVGAPLATQPLFDGTDDASCVDTSGTFTAALVSRSFTSPSPVTTQNPVSLDFRMAFGASNITLPVLNARISFFTTAAGVGYISQGQINGSIPHTNFINGFAPATADLCNTSIQNDPTSNTATSCKSIFDGGCTDFPGYAGDGQIEVCEVLENSLFQSLTAPDVQVADNGTMVAANSMGVRFSAVASDRVFTSGFEP